MQFKNIQSRQAEHHGVTAKQYAIEFLGALCLFGIPVLAFSILVMLGF